MTCYTSSGLCPQWVARHTARAARRSVALLFQLHGAVTSLQSWPVPCWLGLLAALHNAPRCASKKPSGRKSPLQAAGQDGDGEDRAARLLSGWVGRGRGAARCCCAHSSAWGKLSLLLQVSPAFLCPFIFPSCVPGFGGLSMSRPHVVRLELGAGHGLVGFPACPRVLERRQHSCSLCSPCSAAMLMPLGEDSVHVECRWALDHRAGDI